MNRLLLGALACLLPLATFNHLSVVAGELYFPPAKGEWETVKPEAVGWDAAQLEEVMAFAKSQDSTGVVILHRGRIMAEQHWELTGRNSARFNARRVGLDDAGRNIEDVASVQKSVTAFLVGVALQQGKLQLDDPVTKHLGKGWSRATPEQEQAITLRHLLTMSSGLNARLGYEAPPGSVWRYNTTAYAQLMEVVAKAADMDRHEVTKQWLTGPIGMSDSRWVPRGAAGESAGNAFGFATTARDLARFGLLMLAHSKWNGQEQLLTQDYFKAATTSSQMLNPYYGYLWWVSRDAFDPDAKLRPVTAPPDMFSAYGALKRRCYVVPSMELVVTRLGDNPPDADAFDHEFWKRLRAAAPR